MRDRLYHINLKEKNLKKHYKNIKYPFIPLSTSDIYVTTVKGDRLDNLAFQFYGDPNLWWYIAKANNLTTMNVAAGKSLVIPASADGNVIVLAAVAITISFPTSSEDIV